MRLIKRLIVAVIRLPILIAQTLVTSAKWITEQIRLLVKNPTLRIKYLLQTARAHITWRRQNKTNILVNPGVHSVVALMGGGKTLLSNMLVQDMLPDDKFVYVVDRALVDAIGDGRAVYVDLWACYRDGKQIYRLPTRVNGKACYGIILDEITKYFNRRNNKYGNYNDKFLGLVEMIISLRHQGINRVWILSQSYDNIDVQLMRLIKYKHIIYASRRYNYDAYLATQKLLYVPKQLKIVSQIRTDTDDYESVLCQVLDVDYKRHICTYNHRALADEYNQLPLLTLHSTSPKKSDS